MELTNETDHATIAGVFVLTAIVFGLDLLTPSELAVWTLYLVPLGLSRWSFHKNLTVSLGMVCTALIICAHLYNPGTTHDLAIMNRVLGILMVWVSVFSSKSTDCEVCLTSFPRRLLR